jgi:pimeloyl-ACP methyl ester carboxylesterase
MLAAIMAGIVFERAGEARDRKNLPQIGRSFDVGGRSLNLYCSGAGGPTVIFESNGGAPGYRWVRLQREVASLTRACWYDRAGMGWSDPGPFPNHSDSVARDLHNLLAAANIPPPYVLVGHAMGGFHVRVFRSFYPAEVAGLVLVDPMNEDMTINIHNHNELFRPAVIFTLRGLSAMGLLRLLRGNPGPPQHGWTPQEWATLLGLFRQRKARRASAQELPMWVNGELARAGSCYGDVPIVVLSAGIQDQEEDPKLDHDHAWKLQLHERLAHLSTRGTHIVVPNSGHDIPDEAPEAVLDAIRKVLLQGNRLNGSGQLRNSSRILGRVRPSERTLCTD